MNAKYLHFKRFRMEADLRQPPAGLADPLGTGLRAATLPPGFHWLPWRDSLTFSHAEVKALCFQDETDAVIFPSLASLNGCRDLMTAIRNRPGFCPQATWLVVASDLGEVEARTGLAGNCVATVQGVIDDCGHGGIQNVGVVREYRGRGIGPALVLKAVAGFAACGAKRAYLEATAQNHTAMRIYRSLGFRCTKTVYRSVPMPMAEPIALGL
jgi:ribosomal protein S18 acetylase RimI-like enzyme